MDRRARGWRAVLAPELAAGLAAVLIWFVVGAGLLAGGGASASVSPSASQGAAASRTAPAATLDGSLLVLIRSSNARLREQQDALETLLAAESLDTGEVRATVRQINAAATFAASIADRIAAQPGGAGIAAGLHAGYDPILKTAEEILSLALANEKGHRDGAARLVKELDTLPDVDALLAAAVTPSPSPSPSASPSATGKPSRSPSAKPSKTPTPTKTPIPTPTPTEAPTPTPGDSGEATAEPSATPIPSLLANLLVNPGFEAGPDPWEFVLAAGATGSYTITTEAPASGTSAAMISLSSGVGPWAAASLRQRGLHLDNGTNYHVQVWARSTGPRDIRVRVMSGAGEVIASRILSISADWTELAFDLTAIGTVDDASLVVETGISGQTVWLDDLGVGP